MSTSIDLFDYNLPTDRIAQSPVEPRDHCKLMVMDRQTGKLQHQVFYQIIDELRSGDVLVMNDSKVFKARLHGAVGADPGIGPVVRPVELFLLRGDTPPVMEGKGEEKSRWQVLLKPGKKVSVGNVINVGELSAVVLEKREDGVAVLQFDRSKEEVIAYANDYGSIPLPPYIHQIEKHGELSHPTTDQQDVLFDQYQTIYAREVGSVAAPTAGLHFTPELLDAIRAKGVEVCFVTLHVGLGTFRPVKTVTLEEHQMHAEFVEITERTSQAIKLAKQEGRRVIAVGTTTVRALEGSGGEPYATDLNIFITPGFKFQVVDAMITNFHLPKSTLIVMISAFAGRENVMQAYQEAIESNYRFYSFGDAMFIG